MLLDRRRQGGPLLDVQPALAEDPGELLVVGLIRQDRQGTQDRQPRVDHRGELPREHRQLLELDLLLGQLDVEPATLFADLERREALLAEPLQDQRLVVRNEGPADEVPAAVADLVRVGVGHRLPHIPPKPSDVPNDPVAHELASSPPRAEPPAEYADSPPEDPTKRWSSSGSWHRSNAICWLMRPALTCEASDMSIVCIPYRPPACIAE